MKLTKKSLLLAVRQTLNEMPMTFDTPEDRPHRDTERDLANRETPMKKVPFPKDTEEPYSNFEEKVASKRYGEIVANLRQYTGRGPGRGEENMQGIINQMMSTQNEIQQIESSHRTELEALAIELARKLYGVKEGQIEYRAKIERPRNQQWNKGPRNQPNPEEVDPEQEEEILSDLENLNLERAKRRLINAMMQGAALKAQYNYSIVADKIIEITGSDRLLNLYGIVMSTADTMLWQFGNAQLGGLTGGGSGDPQSGGVQKVDINANPPIVHATAINFPILVHELIKGTFEVVSGQHGDPEDFDIAQKVLELEDTPVNEVWDQKLGPVMFDMLRSKLPPEIFTEENKVELFLVFYVYIISKPAKEFLTFMKEILSNSESGTRLANELTSGVMSVMKGNEYEEAMQAFNDDLEELTNTEDDDTLRDFLNNLGVDLPKGDDED
jgi:hypothetical protein